MKAKGSNFHPARISGIQKLIRDREANKPKPQKIGIKPLDLSQGDWSLKK